MHGAENIQDTEADLRPNSEQVTVKHHPYIDILPFPTLRKNLIIHQEEIDEDELFQDLLTGLVCWGGAGIGRKDREDSTGYASTGTPWDVRSWEARVWFLQKYWTLLGGEDGELGRQSEWWRGIRGEDTVEVWPPNVGAGGFPAFSRPATQLRIIVPYYVCYIWLSPGC